MPLPWNGQGGEPVSEWHYLNSGSGEPAWNMALDEALLEHAASLARPVFRTYGWTEPAATFGYSQRYAEVSSWTNLRPLVRRPTGGGLVPHDRDWTYTVVFPPGHDWYRLKAEESYRRVHEWVSAALERLQFQTELAPAPRKEGPGQCFIGAEKFDVLFSGRKIAGAAQRRNKLGLLIQGSLQPPNEERSKWEEMMRLVGTELHGAAWSHEALPEVITARAQALHREKYSRVEYNEGR